MLFSVLPEWTRRVHPLGHVYYHKMHHGREYITRTDITQRHVRDSVHELIDDVERLISLRNDVPSDHILVFLEPQCQGGPDCGYYLIHNAPESRCIFFLHEIDVGKDPKVFSSIGPSTLGACQRNVSKLISCS